MLGVIGLYVMVFWIMTTCLVCRYSVKPSFANINNIFPVFVITELSLERTCCFHRRGYHVLKFTMLHVGPQSAQTPLFKRCHYSSSILSVTCVSLHVTNHPGNVQLRCVASSVDGTSNQC
jgi:hypothetical protein